MATSGFLLIGAAAACFFACAVLVSLAFSVLRIRRLRSRAGTASDLGGSGSFAFMQSGVRVLRKPALRIALHPRVGSVLCCGVKMLEAKNVKTDEAALCSVLLALLAVLFLVGSLIFWSPITGLLLDVACAALLWTKAQSWSEERNSLMREAVPDVIQSMGACSQSGLSLFQTLTQISQEGRPGIKEKFAQSAHVLQAGGTSTEALRCLRSGSDVPELAFVSVALDVQHQTGGSMRQVLDAAKDMVESELELRRSLKVQTAQARLSARVVTVMPFIMLLLLSAASTDFLAPFFRNLAGMVTLGVALSMQLAGVLLVRRMLKVDE